jgi:hypothetical protein
LAKGTENVTDVSRYHVTVLSNLARGFDKYARVYSKNQIPQSTYPDQFFLLSEDSLGIGIEKGERLLAKLDLPENQLIVLESRVPVTQLHPNLRTRLGEYIQSSSLRIHRIHGLHQCEGTWRLVPLDIEEGMAASLKLLESEFQPFHRLLPRSLSVLPIARGCQASCPFCFSDASASAEQEQSKIDYKHVSEFAEIARHRGAERFVITGGGEPGLVPHAKLTELISVGARHLGKAVLITNGYHLMKLDAARQREVLRDYHSAGLEVLAISRHHHCDATNGALMKLQSCATDLAVNWRAGQDDWPSLRLRFTCVLQRGGIEDAAGMASYVNWAADLGVEEICFKELYVSTSVESVYHQHAANQWSREHQVPLSLVLEFARANGFAEVARLPWGAPVFRGQIAGNPMQFAAYTEPSLLWERTYGIARSWNLMADGRCLVSLEDRCSEISLAEAQ